MYEGFESIDDIARGEGFFIDEDGHWLPLEDMDDCGYEDCGVDPDDFDRLYDENDDDYNEETDDWDE